MTYKKLFAPSDSAEGWKGKKLRGCSPGARVLKENPCHHFRVGVEAAGRGGKGNGAYTLREKGKEKFFDAAYEKGKALGAPTGKRSCHVMIGEKSSWSAPGDEGKRQGRSRQGGEGEKPVEKRSVASERDLHSRM